MTYGKAPLPDGVRACREAFEILRKVLEDPRPPEEIPRDLGAIEVLSSVFEEVWGIRRLAMSLAAGDLSLEAKGRGRVLGALKGLQAALRHLTWQTRAIAQGDLAQRVQFLGDFSEAFNGMVEQLARLQQQLRDQAMRDALTGVFNRRFLMEILPRETAIAFREQRPLAFLLLDVDHFKNVNDRFGHQAGDQVLARLGRFLTGHLRTGDLAFRYGGEEFLVLLHGPAASEALRIGDRLRLGFEAEEITGEWGTLNATFSMGVALLPDDARTAEEALRKADEALYRAKALGRNRVVRAGTSE